MSTVLSRSVLQNTVDAPRKPTGLVVLLVSLMAILLNHSANVGGVNLSLADPVMVLAFLALAFAGHAMLPSNVFYFFCIVVASTLFAGGVLSPLTFGITPDNTIFTDLVKMIVSLMFLVCGAGVASLGIHMRTLRWFAYGTVLVALAGVVMEFSGIRLFPQITFYGDFRYRGFMIDPNYWAVLAGSSIAFLARDRASVRLLRVPAIVILTVSVLLSASKTGLVALIVLAGVSLMDRALNSRRPIEAGTLLLAAAIVVASAWGTVTEFLLDLVNRFSADIPQLSRLGVLLTDPFGAVSEGGSGRSDTWDGAIAIIESSPIFGVGIGAYRDVNNQLFGTRAVAHNTYLQIAAEWGLPLAVVFFAWLGVILWRATRIGQNFDVVQVYAPRDMVIVFLVGSLSLSLNNARMFWFFLGILIHLVGVHRDRTRKGHSVTSGEAK